ncbi:hypothetical protein GEV33_001144 [Tenebrio molitor]|uniref:Uncharacterized protein n=1 Tax=Tenebrio molitor TaxID=7067 RepID=A0A8J6LK76_TENMO|nr:hypothetical protein GEV33_001144 [Tenebrio molitor]
MVVPKAAKVPIWASIFKSFTITTWLLIISTCVICTMFWHCIRSSNTASWTMFAVLAGTPTQIVPNNGQSFFLVSCMIFNIVILGVIQGSLFTNFTTTTHYADINTLQELDESELPIAMSLWQFLQVDSDLIRRIQNKSILQTDMTLDLVAYQRNLTTCDSKSYLEFQMRTKYIDNDGLPLLHIVNECLTTCLVANIVPKGSVLLSVFNNVITKAMEICETHFLLVDFLTILVLQTEKHKLEINYFTEALLKVMSGYEFPVALKIEEYFLSANENQTRRVCDESIVDEVGGHNIKPVEYEKLADIKRLSSDSLKGYFIIVWDVDTLHQFLDDNYQIVIPEARATYSLHFVFTSWDSCQGVKYELSDILRRFWIDYNVVNVIAQTPCSCDSQQVYIYRPFVRKSPTTTD